MPISTYPGTNGESVATFVLIPGAWHGSWCWELLAPELRGRGHQVVTVDLPTDDPGASFEDYAAVVHAAVADARVAGAADRADLVLVGHSLAGHVLPWAARLMPVRHLVYLCALVAEPGRSFADQQQAEGMLTTEYLAGLRGSREFTEWADPALAHRLLYGDCDADVAEAAFRRLRPQAKYPMRQVCTLEALPEVPSTYIVCADDRMLDPGWSQRVAVDRLGAELVTLPGGHSPFYSRPGALADVLTQALARIG